MQRELANSRALRHYAMEFCVLIVSLILFASAPKVFASDSELESGSESSTPPESVSDSVGTFAATTDANDATTIPMNQLSLGDAPASSDRSSDAKPPAIPLIFATASREFQIRIGIAVNRPASVAAKEGAVRNDAGGLASGLIGGISAASLGADQSLRSGSGMEADKELLTVLEKQAEDNRRRDASEQGSSAPGKLLETLRKK